MQPVIRFENVGKLYRLGTVGTGTIAHDIQRWWVTSVLHKEDPYLQIGETNDRSTKGSSEYVYALKDINLEVQQGDVLGIIGKNGAGKSTLLKLLSRVTAPTTGKIYTKGRIASLLEVGTGFHGELTGRENIYMNGSILGMKKWEIDKKLDEIIDFSGCERYIDTPVKRYSSGMMVRLGFAVAAHLDPEILVVDEVLAVGDAEFQKKAIGKMQDVSKGEGRTVLFVSHNMAAVKNLCQKGVVLKDGKVDYLGTAIESIDHYLQGMVTHNTLSIKDRIDRDGSGKCRFTGIRIKGLDGNYQLNDDIPITLEVDLSVNQIIHNPRIGISIYNLQNDCALWMDSQSVLGTLSDFVNDCTLRIEITKDFALAAGNYFINLVCYDSNSEMADYVQHAIEFKVLQSTFCKTGFYPAGKSICMAKQNWSFI
ncbi:MAG: ABC transporter ATP-binding protein [Bacteroidales bacterium]|nr:ABC transporter ATP-binding protein [Bacteroidales bacterium]